jgi:hypothetical protein
MTSDDPWTGPACPVCGGRGEIVYTRGEHWWMSVRCEDCHGTGHATAAPPPRYREDGYRLPEDGEEYDPDVHGPVPSSWPGH